MKPLVSDFRMVEKYQPYIPFLFLFLGIVLLLTIPVFGFGNGENVTDKGFNEPFTDPILIFSTILGIILLAPLLFAKMRLPGVIGIIVVGVIIGPSILNLLEPDRTVTLLGQIGLLYIMFIAGLEINLTEFFKHKDRSIIFGTITFIIPQTVGTALFLWMGFDWFAALLIASMFASHTLVAYPVITKLGLTQNKAVITAVGGTIITDTVALLLLAVIASGYQGDLDLEFWGTMSLMLVLYSIIVLVILPRVARWFFSNIQDEIYEFIFVLLLAFGLSYVARAMGIEPIVGAFFVGLVLNRLIPKTSPLMNRIQFVGNSLFIPFFLLYIGLLVDVSVLMASVTAWVVMGAMLTTNVVTKLIASKLTQKICKFSSDEGWVIFGLSTTEAAATLAATLVGYRLGIIGDEVLNGVIIMILVTCIMGPIIVDKFGKNIAVKERHQPANLHPISERILLPMANPESVEELVDLGSVLKVDYDATLYPLTVVNQTGDVEKQVYNAEKILEKASDYASATNIPIKELTRIDVNIANGITRASLEVRATDIIMGWNRQYTASHKIFGTVLDQLLNQTSELLLVSHLKYKMALHKRIILAMPPLVTSEPGYNRMMAKITTMASNLNLEVLVISEYDQLQDIRESFDNSKSSVKVTTKPLTLWDDLPDTISGNAAHGDLLMLVGARQGSLSFRYKDEKLPRTIANTFSENSLIVIYPAIKMQ